MDVIGPAPEPQRAGQPRGRYWLVHLVLLILIAVPMLLFLIAYYALSGYIAPAGIRLLPVLVVSGTLAWLLRDR